MANTKKKIVEKVDMENESINEVTKDTAVTIYNNTFGGLFIRNDRTMNTWSIDGFGIEDEMTVGDIVTIKASYPAIFNDGWAYIDNPDAVKFLHLEKEYKKFINPKEMESFFAKNEDEIGEFIKDINDNTRRVIIKNAKELIRNGKLDSIKKQRLIERILKVKFDEMM